LTLFVFHFFLFEYYSAHALEMHYRIIVGFFYNEYLSIRTVVILVSVLFGDMRSRNIAHIRCILKGTRTWCSRVQILLLRILNRCQCFARLLYRAMFS